MSPVLQKTGSSPSPRAPTVRKPWKTPLGWCGTESPAAAGLVRASQVHRGLRR